MPLPQVVATRRLGTLANAEVEVSRPPAGAGFAVPAADQGRGVGSRAVARRAVPARGPR